MDLFLIISALILHIYIILSEYKHKKIPNKYLLFLFGISILYIFFNTYDIWIISVLIKLLFISIFITVLYILKIWNPSYLKYIFISSLFFLGSLEISFLANIFFIILFYIVSYFCYFYIRLLIDYKQTISIYKSFKKNIDWNIHNWVIKNKDHLILKIITVILWFIAVFIMIRVFRFYIQWELNPYSTVYYIENIYINTLVLIYIWLFITTALLHRLYHKYLLNNYKILGGIISITIVFIIYEFIYDYDFINEYLYRILTFILFLFAFIWIIMHMWKYLFFENDSRIIDYSELNTWDIIDKKIVSSYLTWQEALKEYDIVSIINNIKNPISGDDCTQLKTLIKINSDHQIKHENPIPPNVIRIYNTFLFAPFIFWSFVITLLVQDNLLVNFLVFIFKKTMSLWG